jgi:hypothetical protein
MPLLVSFGFWTPGQPRSRADQAYLTAHARRQAARRRLCFLGDDAMIVFLQRKAPAAAVAGLGAAVASTTNMPPARPWPLAREGATAGFSGQLRALSLRPRSIGAMVRHDPDTPPCRRAILAVGIAGSAVAGPTSRAPPMSILNETQA